MKRVIITGLPCPPEIWEDFLGRSKGQRIIPLWEVFENAQSSDPRVMSRYITEQIEREKPQSIIAHDLGVPMTLLSLMRLNRRGLALDTRVTLFNGAFRKYDVFKANHPFRVQLMPARKCVEEIESRGGAVDLRLKRYLPRIRAMYRHIILFGLAERISSMFSLEDVIGLKGRLRVRSPIQMIASPNDPYILMESIEQLRRDFPPERFTTVEYGHFPYSVDSRTILPLIRSFESSVTTAPRPRRPRTAPREASGTV